MNLRLDQFCNTCSRSKDIYAFQGDSHSPALPRDEISHLWPLTDDNQSTQGQKREYQAQSSGLNVHAASPAYLQNPRVYYHKLRNLKIDVYENSALALSLRSRGAGNPFPYPEAVDLQFTDWRREFSGAQQSDDLHKPAINSRENLCFDLKVYRNIILAAFSNTERLKRSGFVQNQLNILATDPFRRSVADLLWIPLEVIKNLAYMFDDAVRRTDDRNIGVLDLELIAGALTVKCDQLLASVHLSARPPQTNLVEYYSTQAECSRCWNDSVHLLDLAVLVYAGAHVDPFPENINVIERGPCDRFKISERVHLQRQSLNCLDVLLGGAEAWIFSLGPVSMQGGLYVSASADVLADIWGPMWKVHSESDRSILQYNIGSGSIVPWAHEPGEHPQLNVNERLGHWMPSNSTCSGSPGSERVNPWLPTGTSSEDDEIESQDSSDEEPEDAVETPDIDITTRSCQLNAYARSNPFSGSEKLLVGAGSPKLVWNKCHCSVHRITHRLKEKQHLHFLKTSKLFQYVDSKNLSMVAGSHGLTLGANVTIKTQNGRSWKDVLLEVWENQPDARHPRTLESFWGVMISLCTFNAKRVRLTELLGTDSIRILLKPFHWSDSHIKKEFYDAVSSNDPFALHVLWVREERWQEELGKALLTCLRALCQTGYDANRKEMNALWMSQKSTGPKRVVLEPLEHRWVPMLQDSEDSFAAAVVVKKCLGTSSADFGPQNCIQEGGWHASTRLETAIAINHEIQNSALEEVKMCQEDLDMWRTRDHMWKRRWDVSNINQGETFWIASPHARLRTVQTLTRSHLLMEWNVIKRNKLREFVGLQLDSKRPGHWEYTDDEDQPPVRPIPVHIQ